jgi:DNA-directed RNA polymerase subunit RPC12/RpoP
MTSPVEEIEVQCPKCGQVYSDWYRPSINLTLDDFDDEYLEAASTSACPECGHKVRHNVLTVREDGVWEFSGDNDEHSGQDPPE